MLDGYKLHECLGWVRVEERTARGTVYVLLLLLIARIDDKADPWDGHGRLGDVRGHDDASGIGWCGREDLGLCHGLQRTVQRQDLELGERIS